MPDSSPCVFLDTSFLVALCDDRRENHETAKRYFRFWTETGVPMIVSAIAYAEYLAEDELPPLVLNAVSIAPFDASTARMTGRITRLRHVENLAKANGDAPSRDERKDDFKIIAHACEYGAKAIVTEDVKTFPKYVRFAAERIPEASCISLIQLKDGFNPGIARSGSPEFDFGASV